MKKTATLSCFAGLSLLVLTACATRPAPDLAGRWKPINRYAVTPQEIPLYQSYVFFVSPLDGTLKNTLERWAKDSKMTLSYLHPSDFTLHAQAADIRTSNLQDALNQLSAAYASQQVIVMSEQNQIVVRIAEGVPVSTGATTPNP
ncbi:MAG: TcpQ domain-containing protein [Arenimonas sp.]